jgi:hypothetical protein
MSMTQSETRLAEISKLIRTPEDLSALRQHLNDIVQGEAFRGSRRSAQFLQYVVEKSLSQDASALKERSIGIELFGRDPVYDTSEDAIVRVTAVTYGAACSSTTDDLETHPPFVSIYLRQLHPRYIHSRYPLHARSANSYQGSSPNFWIGSYGVPRSHLIDRATQQPRQ